MWQTCTFPHYSSDFQKHFIPLYLHSPYSYTYIYVHIAVIKRLLKLVREVYIPINTAYITKLKGTAQRSQRLMFRFGIKKKSSIWSGQVRGGLAHLAADVILCSAGGFQPPPCWPQQYTQADQHDRGEVRTQHRKCRAGHISSSICADMWKKSSVWVCLSMTACV